MITQGSATSQELHAGMGELVHADRGRLAIHGLGSCIALCFWSRERRVGALCHIVLPTSGAGVRGGEPARFADVAVPAALAVLAREYRVAATRVTVKMAGGAMLFKGRVGALAIGPRNIEAVRLALREAGLAPVAEDTGGTHGRSALLDVQTGQLHVQRFGTEGVVL